MFSRGHLPDHEAVKKSRRGVHLLPGLKMTTALPLATTNRAKLPVSSGGPGVLNQKGVGACEGFGHASAGTLRLANLGISKGLLSPVQLYLGALMCDQTLQADGTLSVVTDTGTMPQSIQNAWLTFGAKLASGDPQYPVADDNSNIYKDPADPNSPLLLPAMETLYGDGSLRYQGAYFVTATGSQRFLQAMNVLAAGRTMTDAIPASGSQFQSYSGGILGALSGPIDHCNHILDYEWSGTAEEFASFVAALANGDDTTVAKLAPNLLWHCVNSWDVTWGEADAVSQQTGGLYRANSDYFTQAEDLCAIDISSAS